MTIQAVSDFQPPPAESSSDRPSTTIASAEELSHPALDTTDNDVSESTPAANDSQRIQELLEDVQPRTWVFAGDDLGFEVQQARRGWIEHFSDYIHERLGRQQDIILNSSFSDATIDHLLKDVDWRILRFQPDVVVIMPSVNECSIIGTRDEFRETLRQLIQCLHDEGCTVVLSTPPGPADCSMTVNEALKTAASRIRSVANQSGAVLADNFSHWQATIQRDGDNAGLHDDQGQQPSARGHRELARRLLKSLNVRSS